MTDDLAKERHEMVLERITELKDNVRDDVNDIRTSIKDTCTALTAHAKLSNERYEEFQTVQQTVNTAQKVLKWGAAAVSALGIKEIWNFLRH